MAECVHLRVTATHAAPGARWACVACGQSFHPVSMSCLGTITVKEHPDFEMPDDDYPLDEHIRNG